VSQYLQSHACYAFACRSEFSLGGAHGAILHGVAALLGRTIQEAAQWALRSFFDVYPSVVLFVFLFFVVVPVVQILRRTGHNPVWCLVALVPGLNFLAFWFLAPTDKKSAKP